MSGVLLNNMSSQAFRVWEHKAITLLGMSGVGKTTLAHRLPKERWFHYSGDYRIGTRYLDEAILDNIKRQAMQVPFLADLLRSDAIYIGHNITVNNLTAVSTFLGMIGNPSKGGLRVDEFKRRQALHRDAEIRAMLDVREFIAKARDIYGYAHFLNDAGGSLCELDDEQLYRRLAKDTVIVYLKAPEEMLEELIARAIRHPKPLYYQESFLDNSLAVYQGEHALERVEDIDPTDFSRWVFPRLVAHRLPRYQRIADSYGVTVDARQLAQITGEDDFIELICETLDSRRYACASEG